MNLSSQFISLEGKKYTVVVGTDPDIGEHTPVPMSGNPVSINFEAPEKMFTPIRRSTCTIRFILEDYPMGLYSGKADGTEAYITETDTGKMIWCGYLQPCLYNQGYSEPLEILELECSDYLSALQYYDYSTFLPDRISIVSFRKILTSISDRFPRLRGFAVAPIGTGENGLPISFENLVVSEANFFSSEGEPWTWQEVLSEMCQFLGMTAVIEGDILYIFDPADTGPDKRLMFYQKSTGYKPYSIAPFKVHPVGASSYRGTGADMSLDEVFNKVTVKDEMYNIESLLPDLFEDEKLRNLNGDKDAVVSMDCVTRQSPQGPLSVGKAYYKVFENSDWKSHFYTKDPDTKAPVETELTEYNRSHPQGWDKYIMPTIEDYAYAARGEKFKRLNWKRCLCLCQHNSPITWPKIAPNGKDYALAWDETQFVPLIETKKIAPVVYSKGSYLIFDFSAMRNFFIRQPWIYENAPEDAKKIYDKKGVKTYVDYQLDAVNLQPALTFMLSANGLWWNGTGWQPSKCHFYVPCHEVALDNYYYTDTDTVRNIPTEAFIDADGYKIDFPEDNGVLENLYLAVCQPRPMVYVHPNTGSGNAYGEGGNSYTWVSKLSLSVEKEQSAVWSDDDIVFENIIDEDHVVEGPEIVLKLTSINEKSFSLSTVGYKEVDKVKALGKIKKPNMTEYHLAEENIIEQYVSQYSTPSIRENITIGLQPDSLDTIEDAYWPGKKFIVMGRDVDLAMDRQTLNIMEIKENKK